MPLDFSMLLNQSPPSYLPLNVPFDYMEGDPPFACRRVASFPMVNRHFPKPSSLKCRSLSENGLNGCQTLNGLTMQDFKRELTKLIEAEEQSTKNSRKTSLKEETPSPTSPLLSPTKSKKKVLFADDCGKELFTVREMLEPSDVPPKLTSPIVRAILGIEEFASDIEARPSAQWLLDFKQPASEYMKFRERIDKNNAALENVVIKNDMCRLSGTIKVKNISFEKEVFIRFTDNSWRSYNDRECKYLPNKARVADIYDTFQFDIEIPCDDETREIIEFCICYRAGDREFWDNNDSENFRIVSERYRIKRYHNQPTTGQRQQQPTRKLSPSTHIRPTNDAFALDCANWTEFSSWKDLSNSDPYW